MVSKGKAPGNSSTSSATTPPPTVNGDNGQCNNNENQTANTPPNCQNTVDSTACLISPSNIHISHMYVYNFTPDLGRESPQFESPLIKVPQKYQSPAASSGPICRICHEGDGKEDLVSPCRCAGTVGLVHKSCMERWLSTRCNTNDKCEICHYSFATVRSPKSILEWIRSDENDSNERHSLIGDVMCFFLLTPLAVVSSFLCVEGAKRQVMWGNSLEAGCLMALATFLITIYFVWNVLTLRYNLKNYLKWRAKNHNVKLVRVQRASAGNEEVQSRHCVQVISQVPSSNCTPSIVIPISETTDNTVQSNVFASV